MRKAVLVFIFLCSFIGIQSFAQDSDFSKATIKVQKIAGSVYMLQGPGGNIAASVGDDGIVMVDAEFLPLSEKLEAALKGISDKPLKFVLNTHWHGDHTEGNAYFSKKATVIAHKNVRNRLQFGGKNRFFGDAEPAEKSALPILTFANDITLHFNGEDIHAIHIPNSHTDGDSVVFFPKSNAIHMGDDFLNLGTFPFIDLDSGGSVQGWIAGVEKVLADVPEDVKVIPGHGPLCTKDDLRKFVAMLKETSAVVQEGINQHKTVEQLKSEKVLAKWDSLGKGFIKPDMFIEMLYESLTRNSAG